MTISVIQQIQLTIYAIAVAICCLFVCGALEFTQFCLYCLLFFALFTFTKNSKVKLDKSCFKAQVLEKRLASTTRFVQNSNRKSSNAAVVPLNLSTLNN